MKKNFTERERILARKLFSLLKFVPDKPYLKFYYRVRTGKKLDLKNPKGYNEKLNWLKIYNRHPLYTKMADKLLVRDIVKEKLGEGYSIPLLGTWKTFDDVDFETLPNSFVLKCNHDSGSVKVIKDKKNLTISDKKILKKHFDRHIKLSPYNMGRQWPYKDIEPLIIAEEYMGGDIVDYKFMCFNGEPKIFFRETGGKTNDTRRDYFDMDGNALHFNKKGIKHSDVVPTLPSSFDTMKDIVKKLVIDIPYIRVDLIEVDGKIYFAEYTFFNDAGILLFEQEEWERKLGDMIDISKID